MKKILWILLSVILAAGVAVCIFLSLSREGVKPDATESTPSWEQRVIDQQYAVAASDALVYYFHNNGYVTDYPDYYGGCYIADNVLHIRLCSPSEETMSELKMVLSVYSPVVVYESCDFSYTKTKEYADTVAMGMVDKGLAVTSWYVSQQTGNIEIKVLAEDLKEATKFAKKKKKKGYPPIVVSEGNYVQLQ